MTSSPGSFGSPRSTMATSSGYSRAANNPSSPSRATSTVKPASASRSLSESRNAASSSTTSTRMPVLSSGLLDRAIGRIDTHRPDLAGRIEQAQHVAAAAAVAVRLGLDHARVKALLNHFYRLVHGDRSTRHPGGRRRGGRSDGTGGRQRQP